MPGQRLVLAIPETVAPPRIESFAALKPTGMAVVEGFRQRDPHDGDPVSHGTLAFVAYDREQLYVVFVCRDDPEAVRARMTRRDDNSGDDTVSVFLDTFDDHRRAYVFTSNPLGVQSDRMKTEGQEDDESFDAVWETEGRLTAFGYVVQMAIPFRSLRFGGGPVQAWGIALSRRIQRLNEEAYWPLVSKRLQAFVPQFARVEGLRPIDPGSNLQVVPYGVFTDARAGDRATPSSRDGRFGFDAKAALSNAFVLDATVSPDFSEVESDEPQVTVNERFEVLFAERRPFFVENAGYFNTPIPLFFSRRILDPRFGARLTGKSGPWVIGGLAAPDRSASSGSGAVAVVGSVRRELGRDSHVGVLATVRNGQASANRTVSVDGRWTLGANWAAVGQLVGTGTSAGSSSRDGAALFGELTRSSRHLNLLARYRDLTPAFDAALGFIKRVDIRQFDHSVAYRFRPRRGPIVKYGPALDSMVVWDHARALQDWRVRPRFGIDFVGQTSLVVDRSASYERYAGLDFEKTQTNVEFETARSQTVSLSTAYGWGTDINRKPADGQVPALADSRSASVALRLRGGRRILFEQRYLLTELRLPAVGGAGILTNHILRSKLNVHVTRALSFRAILDYERLTVDASRSSVTPKQPIGIDLLGAFQLHPGSAVFIGYAHRLEPASGTPSSTWTPEMESVGRQFFVKVSWPIWN